MYVMMIDCVEEEIKNREKHTRHRVSERNRDHRDSQRLRERERETYTHTHTDLLSTKI